MASITSTLATDFLLLLTTLFPDFRMNYPWVIAKAVPARFPHIWRKAHRFGAICSYRYTEQGARLLDCPQAMPQKEEPLGAIHAESFPTASDLFTNRIKELPGDSLPRHFTRKVRRTPLAQLLCIQGFRKFVNEEPK
jgi:hypothetical protein